MPNLDDMVRGTRSFDQLTSDTEAMRDAMKRLRDARWAMPVGERVFPKIPFNAHDFNALVENPCFQSFMMDIRRQVYEARVIENLDIPLPLIMAFSIFDDIEREMFPEDLSEPETPSLQEE